MAESFVEGTDCQFAICKWYCLQGDKPRPLAVGSNANEVIHANGPEMDAAPLKNLRRRETFVARLVRTLELFYTSEQKLKCPLPKFKLVNIVRAFSSYQNRGNTGHRWTMLDVS